jgi:ABC-type sulfate/molybdate transport systems ATPase subunit
LRAEMLDLIRALVASRKTTVVYVTHSWPEALEICERLAVLSDGRLIQEGPTAEVFRHPASAHVARLTGPVVEFPAAWVHTGRVGGRHLLTVAADGESRYVRPHQIRFVAPAGSNRWQVLQSQPHGHGWRLLLESGSDRWTVLAFQPLAPGDTVAVEINAGP